LFAACCVLARLEYSNWVTQDLSLFAALNTS
jgi:hypothetical protein